MDTESVSVMIDATAMAQCPSSSSYSQVVIFKRWHVEKHLQDKRSHVIYSLGSYLDHYLDHCSTLTFGLENLTPNYLLRRVDNELQDLDLSEKITDGILAQFQRADLPQGQPLLVVVSVKFTRRHYLETEETCAVCLDDFETKPMWLFPGCFHQFHEECLREWIDRRGHNSCPLCRHPVR